MFSHMKHALQTKLKTRVSLWRGVQDALNHFRWMLANIQERPTQIGELVPLLLSAEGHHDASAAGAGGIWFPAPHVAPREGYEHAPVIWRLRWPQEIIDRLVTADNPNGDITNSDLELAGGLIHLEALCQTFDVRERTVLSKTDNLNTLFWERKGSATTDKVPAHLLRLFGIHQRFHRYVPRHDYQPGLSNPVADACSRDFHLSWSDLIADLSVHLPESDKGKPQVWTPSNELVSCVLSALAKKRSEPESLWIEPAPPRNWKSNTLSSVVQWPLTPFSKPSKTKYDSYTSSDSEYKPDNLRSSAVQSGLERLKVTYGSLYKRPLVWGPRNNAPPYQSGQTVTEPLKPRKVA